MTTKLILTYEMTTCDRCGGTGEYPSAMWQGACIKCWRKGEVMTAAGKRAFARFSAIEAEMNVTWGDINVGDRVLFVSTTKTWVTVTDIVADKLNADYFVFTFSNGQALMTKLPFEVKRYDRDVWVRAARDAARLSGATLTGDDEVAEVAPQAPKATGSHAACTHERTSKARAACRRARNV